MSEKAEEERKMVVVCVHVPKWVVDRLDELVKQGEFPSRSEAVREAIKEFLEGEERGWEELELEFLEGGEE
jgi:Arc/MetJ-type ribon-helix-helix transcriptional regulator